MKSSARGQGLGAVFAAALAFFLLARPAAAQNTATVQIAVTPQVTRSLTVALQGGTTTSYPLGVLNLGALTAGATPYVLTNTGNIWETFALQISSEVDAATPSFPWHSTDNVNANLAVADAYELFAQFASTAAAPAFPFYTAGASYLVEKAALVSAGGLGGQFASVSQSGMDVHAVPGENAVGLWFAIESSSYTTTVSQKHVVVTVVAQ